MYRADRVFNLIVGLICLLTTNERLNLGPILLEKGGVPVCIARVLVEYLDRHPVALEPLPDFGALTVAKETTDEIVRDTRFVPIIMTRLYELRRDKRIMHKRFPTNVEYLLSSLVTALTSPNTSFKATWAPKVYPGTINLIFEFWDIELMKNQQPGPGLKPPPVGHQDNVMNVLCNLACLLFSSNANYTRREAIKRGFFQLIIRTFFTEKYGSIESRRSRAILVIIGNIPSELVHYSILRPLVRVVESIDWTVVRTLSDVENIGESDPAYLTCQLVDALQKMKTEVLGRKEVLDAYTKHCETEEHATLCGNPQVSNTLYFGVFLTNVHHRKCPHEEGSHSKICSGCDYEFYCSRKCQKQDWQRHREFCYDGER